MSDRTDREPLASKVVRNLGYFWEGVAIRDYKADGTGFRDISRHTLLGDGVDEMPLSSVLRYFEIAPGGYSSLERHEHPHSVVIVRGEGHVILGPRVEHVAMLDCVYVAPSTFHQFHATGSEPLGFLCVVDRERDRPELPSAADLEILRSVPSVARMLRV
jgi:mannose-6-phosphate isomerase-like protein (cupin superfamily)